MSAVLSILLSNPDKWPTVADRLHADLFAAGERDVFVAYERLATNGLKPDAVMVSDEFPADHPAQETIQRIVERFDSAHSLDSHVDILLSDYRTRQAEAIGRKLAGGLDPEKAVSELTALISGVTSCVTVGDLTAGVFDDICARVNGGVSGISTGITGLDNLLGGLQPGNLCIIAGRPGMGKTCLASNILQTQKTQGAFFSLEMSAGELVERMLAATGVDYGRIRRPRDGDIAEISEGMKRLNRETHIFDKGGMTIAEIEAEAYRLKHRGGLSVIVVDYLQIVRAPGDGMYAQASEASRRLKALAKNLDVPVIAVAQLNRQVESRGKSKPKVSDLRESGQIEQDADQVILCYRPSVYDEPGHNLLIVGKNRAGICGDVPVTWQGKYQRFVNPVWGA